MEGSPRTYLGARQSRDIDSHAQETKMKMRTKIAAGKTGGINDSAPDIGAGMSPGGAPFAFSPPATTRGADPSPGQLRMGSDESCPAVFPYSPFISPRRSVPQRKIAVHCTKAQIPINLRKSNLNKTSHFREASPSPSHSLKIVPRRTISPILSIRRVACPLSSPRAHL